MENFEILFDNGGGATLITDTFCHYYDIAKDLAEDVAALMRGETTDEWEGDQPDFRREKHAEDRRITNGTVERALAGKLPKNMGGHMQTEFWRELTSR